MRQTKVFVYAVVLSMALIFFASPSFADTYYVVKPGDTLWKIATSHGITVNKLQELNSLNTTLIFPGQSLLISGGCSMVQQPQVSRGSSRIQGLLDYAKSLVGSPYRYGGESPGGFDCSGYVKYVFKSIGINMPRTAAEQYKSGNPISSSEARPGDLVFFHSGGAINHSGIYLGGGKFVSSTSSSGVKEASVYGSYWAEHFYGYNRIIP
jgi:peptidoglycan endopeptidase LytE